MEARKAKRNFAPMPLHVLASNASPQEKLFVLAIFHHDWDGEKAWPSMARLARITGFKERTLQITAKDLEARGWLKVVRAKGKSNTYETNIPDMTLDEFNEVLKKTTAPHAVLNNAKHGVPCATSTASDAPPPPHDVPPNESPLNESHQREPKASKDAASRPYLEAFGKRWTDKTGLAFAKPTRAKQEIDRIRQTVTLAEFEALADAYFALDDPYLSERGWPLVGLTSWRWDVLRLAQGEQKPKAGPESPKVVL